MAYPVTLWASVLSALLGAFQFGYHLGVLNTCLEWMASDLGFNVAKGGSVVTSAAFIGAAMGSLGAGHIADKIGPKLALIFNNITLVIGSLLCAVSPGGLWAAILGRIFAGLGAGAASLYVPRYLAEISPAAIRGGIATLNQVFICLGILIAYLVGLPYIGEREVVVHIGGQNPGWWRFMLALGVVPAASQMVLLATLPESPVWLRWKGRSSAATAAEKRLLGSEWQIEEEGLLDPPEAGPAEAAESKGWGELLNPKYRWIMLLTTMLPLFQQLSGINTCILYSSEVFKEAGLRSPVLGSIIMGAINLASTLLAAALMDKLGRRLLLILSHSGMGSCLLLIALVSFVPRAEQVQAFVSFVALLVFVLFFGLGVGPIPWVYLPEVLPNDIKGPGASLGTCINWVSTFLVSLSFPLMLRALAVGGSYLVYAVLNFVALGFAYAYVVETKRRPLAEIQKLLIPGRPPAE